MREAVTKNGTRESPVPGGAVVELSVNFRAGGERRQLFPWGSHPDLDPLWSTEAIEFVHDGFETTRCEKIERIARCEEALRYLRVCVDEVSGEYNCGRCSKCVRTMIALRLAGALGRCRTLPSHIDLDRVSRTVLVTRAENAFWSELLDRARGVPIGDPRRDEALIGALASAVERPERAMRFWRVLHGVRMRLIAMLRWNSRIWRWLRPLRSLKRRLSS